MKVLRLFCCRSAAERRASAEFDALDVNVDHHLSEKELHAFVAQHAELWAMLSVNLGLPEERCQKIATDVAFKLACGGAAKSVGAENDGSDLAQEDGRTSHHSMSEDQFVSFKTRIVDDPKGQQLFFHRTVFAAFDKDGNEYLDSTEVDAFLDVFYEAGSIFKGDARLPQKEELAKMVREKLDVDGDGRLTFEEMHSLISGTGLD
jgi:Ca2+-binding EF-hand superfamily protein